MKNKITIVTHSSKFHADDVFAVATLMLLLEKDHEITVVRSRDPDVAFHADYVVDTGFVYSYAAVLLWQISLIVLLFNR